MGARIASTWTMVCYLPRHVSRKMGGSVQLGLEKVLSWDANVASDGLTGGTTRLG